MKKYLSIILVFSLIFTYIPFGNFVNAKNNLTSDSEKTIETASQTAEKVEVVDERTEVSKTFDNLDGTFSTEISQVPIHYQNEDGKWVDIDNELKVKNQVVQNTANSFLVEFNKDETANLPGVQITEDPYQLNLELKETNNQTIEQARSVSGQIAGNQITYEEVFEDISAIYTVGENYVKEDIVLHEIPKNGVPEKFTYQLDLTGLTYKNIDNKIYLYDIQTNELIYILDAPYMYDAFLPEGFQSVEGINSVPEEAKSYDIELQTREENQQLFLDLIPNQKWITAEERQYPIVIDPMLVRVTAEDKTGNVTDTTIRSNFPTTTGGNDKELGVGTASDGNIVRSFLKFDLKSIPYVAHILSADINLHLTSTNASSKIAIGAHTVLSEWSEDKANWTKTGDGSTTWKTTGGDFAATAFHTVNEIGTVKSSIEDNLYKWTIPEVTIEKWVSNASNNKGLVLKSTKEDTKVYKKFASSESTVDIQYKPKLVVTYKTSGRLGLENYWDYTSHALAEGTQYVNLGTLNNVVQYQDFSLMNYADFGLDFTRTYNSKDYEKSAFGYGWTFTGDQKLYLNTGVSGSDIQYKDADGTIHVYTLNSNGTYKAPNGLYDTLKKVDAKTYTLETPDKIVTTFTVKESTVDTNVKVAYITKEQDRNGNSINYQYTNNQLTSIYTNLGKIYSKQLTFEYKDGFIVKATYNNQVATYTYKDGYLVGTSIKKDASNETKTTFSYKNGYLSKITDPNNNETSFTYTSADLATVIEPQLEGEEPSETSYVLDRSSNQMTVTSPEGEETYYFLNDNFVFTGITTETGDQTTYTIDDNYNILQEQRLLDEGKVFTKTSTYDSKGNLLTTIDSDGNQNQYTYDDAQNVLTEQDASGATTTYTYDTAGNLICIRSPDDEKTTYTYGEFGELVQVKLPTGIVETYEMNYENGQKKTESSSGDSKTTTITDFNGNIISYTDGNDRMTNYTYNLKNELTQVKDANASITAYTYDGTGNLTSSTNAKGYTSTLQYNSQNQVQKEIIPISSGKNMTMSYAYDADGELKAVTKPDGQVISYETVEETPGEQEVKTKLLTKVGGQTAFETITDGLTTSIQNKAVHETVNYTSSENGALENITFQSKHSIDYVYINGQLSSMKFGNQSVGYEYNSNGQIETLHSNKTKVKFAYNGHGMETQRTFGANTANITREYNKQSSGLLQQETLSSINTKQIYTYAYDANEQITKITNGSNDVTHTYDALNQLVKEVYSNGKTIAYTYDTVGNRISKTITDGKSVTTTNATFNAANQLTKVGTQDYTYDVNGNLTNDGRYQYTWNTFDQLTEVKTTTGALIATYQYDENGRRVYSKVDNSETYYRYDGTSNQVLFEEDADRNVTKSYTYDSNGSLLTMTYNTETYNYLTNYRGDVLALTDASGKIVAEYTYDAWGNILTQSGTMAKENPYRYASYRYDEETKLYYLMARYYNPDTGVFLTLDPIRGDTMNPITMNGYNYANNNPVMMVDPDGEHPILTVIKTLIMPILVSFAKKYGKKIFDETVKKLLKNRLQPLINKHLKDYQVTFYSGEVIFKITKTKKGRLFSFDYGNIPYLVKNKQKRIASFHYHMNYEKMHYVYRWNSAYRDGYKFYHEKGYKWVWI